jgi:hypothetical protein
MFSFIRTLPRGLWKHVKEDSFDTKYRITFKRTENHKNQEILLTLMIFQHPIYNEDRGDPLLLKMEGQRGDRNGYRAHISIQTKRHGSSTYIGGWLLEQSDVFESLDEAKKIFAKMIKQPTKKSIEYIIAQTR